MSEQLQKSQLITLSNGQIVGHPITRRALKRELRQARLQRRAQFRAEKRNENANAPSQA